MGTRSGQRDLGAEQQETARDVALKALESFRGSHLTEALVGEASGPFQPLLSLPGKNLGCVDPRSLLATRKHWERHPKTFRIAVPQT